jgi:hypothetical protein
MDAATRSLVRRRAGDRCEYCLLRQEHDAATLHVDHILARQHGGDDDPSNLSLACHHCNLHKGPNLSGIDPVSGTLTPLFNPRRDAWPDHFEFQGAVIVGLTPIGRTTALVLALNSPGQFQVRHELIARGAYP